MPRILVPLAICTSLAVASPALASDQAAAEALFQAGKSLMDKKNYAEACPKLEASYKLDPAVGTLLNLADCHEKQGLLAQAWSEWGEARDKAKREGDKDRSDLAARRQTTLDPRVPRLTVNVKGSVGGLGVYRDTTKLEPVVFGLALPVNPGPHTVTIRRGDKVLKESTIESKEKAKDEVTLDATDIPPPPPEETAQPIVPGNKDKKREKPEMVRRSTGLYAGGIVLGIAGGIGVLIGGALVSFSNGNRGVAGAGVGFLLIGGGMFAGGVAMGVIGNQKVPRKPEKAGQATLFIGPTSATLHMTF